MQEVNFNAKDLVDQEGNSVENISPKVPPKQSKFRIWYNNLSSNQKTIFFATLMVGIALILGIITFSWILIRANFIKTHNTITTKKVSTQISKKTTTTKVVKEYQDPLNGVYVTNQSILQKPPLAVMIENYYPDARPQMGLDEADLVYENQVEGGITRFMAVFLANSPTMVGPIRSARLYYISWALGIGAIYTHWGGNIYALEKLQNTAIPSIDGIDFGAPGCSTSGYTFCRSSQRLAPHNAYGNTVNMWSYAQSQGLYSASDAQLGSNITPYKFANTPKQSLLGANGSSINITFSSNPDYNVQWIYNQSNNNYIRYNGGTLQYDALNNQEVVAKNVVVMYVSGSESSYPGDGTTEPYSLIWILNTTGSGKATIFNNGQEIQGTWTKSSDTSRMTFTDSNGNPITFQRGTIWFEILQPQTGSFTYTPATTSTIN
jgi:hypothetical protein